MGEGRIQIQNPKDQLVLLFLFVLSNIIVWCTILVADFLSDLISRTPAPSAHHPRYDPNPRPDFRGVEVLVEV